jgi:hypothetical protein
MSLRRELDREAKKKTGRKTGHKEKTFFWKGPDFRKR